MRLIHFAIGAALAGTPIGETSVVTENSDIVKPLVEALEEPPGPEVMKPLPEEPTRCLTARCASV